MGGALLFKTRDAHSFPPLGAIIFNIGSKALLPEVVRVLGFQTLYALV